MISVKKREERNSNECKDAKYVHSFWSKFYRTTGHFTEQTCWIGKKNKEQIFREGHMSAESDKRL